MPAAQRGGSTAATRSPEMSSMAIAALAQRGDRLGGIRAQCVLEHKAHRRRVAKREPQFRRAVVRRPARRAPRRCAGRAALTSPSIDAFNTLAGTFARSACGNARTGGLDQCARQADGARRVQATQRRATCAPRMRVTRRGLPSVSVPVLSNTTTSTCAKRSSASPDFTSTPRLNSRPVATTCTAGTARPSAQGQVMISTATAFMQRHAQADVGRVNAERTQQQRAEHPAEERQRRQRVHDRHVERGSLVGQAHEARAPLLARFDQSRELRHGGISRRAPWRA